MNKLPLYFIALIPAEPLKEQINALKIKCSKSYQSDHALRSPPHITIIPPFNMNIENDKIVTELLVKFADHSSPFKIGLSGFGAFKPRVIYIKIKPNNILREIQISLAEQFDMEINIPFQRHKPFRPHITVAFRDLSPEMFYKAWEKYKYESFESTFAANSIFLLRHNGRSWDIANEFPFGESVLPS